ncbi:hypothetical protein ZO58_004640 [Salmonella enterica subsp. enterica]|nr:hypothetical protein [Salmonella enterica subsp. enterica]
MIALMASPPMMIWYDHWHCCKVRDAVAFCITERPYISNTLFTRHISPRG